jgi:pimeloyl-ACP methyl ester carboxylesterase
MGYGATIDSVIGKLSRFLHLRQTDTDTSRELAPYLDLALEEMLPDPGGSPLVHRARKLNPFDRFETLSWKSAHVPRSAAYAKRHEGEYAKNQTAFARWLRPRAGRRRSILLHVHGWLEPGSWLEEGTLLPMFYKELGVDVAHIQLPFHGRRSPPGQLFHGEWFWTADLVRSLEAVTQAVTDVRSAMAYFRALGYQEVGVSGLSLGGCIAMLLACVDPAPDYVVPMIAHLELAEAVEEAPILWRMKKDLERFGLDKARRTEIFTRIPLARARPKLAPDRQLWVAAREDGYLKAALVEKQWREWNEPTIQWIAGGHMTFPLALDSIVARMRALPKFASR